MVSWGVIPLFPSAPGVVVAIPANNEGERLALCLAALAGQRDELGAPLADTAFEVLVFANNCTDQTAAIARHLRDDLPFPLTVVEETLSPERATAGWARRRAMDEAADHLTAAHRYDGLILTTDADSVVAPTWIAATLRAVAEGADAVAGYVDGMPAEKLGLGSAFLTRGRREEGYLRVIAEVYAVCDPRPHDPWPNHRVSSGASLAVTLAAYRAIGGLPTPAVGEDAALTFALDCAGFRVRHAMDVCVSTSCRLNGRAPGGAADTMRQRHAVPDMPCGDDLEPALAMIRRAILKGRLRRLFETGLLHIDRAWLRWLGLSEAMARGLLDTAQDLAFEEFWAALSASSPVLAHRATLRPADLPRQVRRAEVFLRLCRAAPARTPAAFSREVA